MANQKIQIQKTVYNNAGLSKIVDREFKAFAEPVPEQDPDTVEELSNTPSTYISKEVPFLIPTI